MSPSSIQDFSLEAAKRYLQSAVFIDDNIYNQSSATPDEVANVEVRQPKAVMEQATAAEEPPREGPPANGTPAPEAPPFRTKDLVGSFADHGIVCALYEPEPNFPTDENSTVFKLCQTADLIALDWDFHEVGVKGTKPKSLIENLIKSGNRVAPHHVRLIAIYTNTPSLQSIANSIFQHLEAGQVKVDPIDNCPLRLQAGSSRIVVLGKAGGVARIEAEKPFTVAESELAGRLVNEFASMNHGILPSCALLGMAAVRRNSRRILDKFRADMDAQFLLHRALIRTSEEAFDQLPELLGDEFRAVVEDAEYRPEDLAKFVAVACAEVAVKPPVNPWKIGGEECQRVLKDFWVQENALRKRLEGRDKEVAKADGPQPKKPVESLAMMCSPENSDAHERFAALLALRTQYKADERTLGFGTIVLDRATNQYSVCIMPLCDSLRLKSLTAFPFWKLAASGKGNPVIIQRDNGQLLKLVFEPAKPSACMWIASFVPHSTKGVVSASKDSSGKQIFKGEQADFEWVAQLKPSHGQRIANAIAQQLSRVGLTEAEWARLSFATGSM
jgi:hypothetical protein